MKTMEKHHLLLILPRFHAVLPHLRSINSLERPSASSILLPNRRGWRGCRVEVVENSKRGEERRSWFGTEEDGPFEA